MKLVLFDLDGTLVKSWTSELLPGAVDWLTQDSLPAVAIVTNQGGVGLKYWMETENLTDFDGIVSSDVLPTPRDVISRLDAANLLLVPTFISWAYQSKRGMWGPVPTNRPLRYDIGERVDIFCSWDAGWRKPYPGMLLEAMRKFNMLSSDTLMVGDMESDRAAALAAGCGFQWADDFFNRGEK